MRRFVAQTVVSVRSVSRLRKSLADGKERHDGSRKKGKMEAERKSKSGWIRVPEMPLIVSQLTALDR